MSSPSLSWKPASRTRGTVRILVGTALAGLASGAAFDYPDAPRDPVVDVLHGVEVADPYRWLEETDSERTRDWLAAQEVLADSHFETLAKRDWFRERLTQLQDFTTVSVPEEAGGRLFFTRREGLQAQAVLYWREDREGADETILVDPNEIDPQGLTSLAGWSVDRLGRHLVYGLRESGTDWVTLHIVDVESGDHSPETLRWVKSASVSWTYDGRGFFYGRPPQPPPGKELRAESVQREVWFHTLGREQDEGELVYELPPEPRRSPWIWESEDGRFQFLGVREGTRRENELYWRKTEDGMDAPFRPLFTGFDADWRWLGEHNGRFIVFTSKDAPKRRIVSVDPEAPDQLETLIEESEHTIASATLAGDRLFVRSLVDAADELTIHDLDGELVGRIDLPNMASVSRISGRRASRSVFYGTSGADTPGRIYRLDLETLEPQLHHETAVDFDPERVVVERLWFESLDGTRVPLFLTRLTDTPRDGRRPVMLRGYGGFHISMGPRFQTGRIAWLEAGGVEVTVCLRGGGEFGSEWHRAGKLENKTNVFDDFLAASRFLAAEGWTEPSRIAIDGRSNGGLLTGASLVRNPEAFGCVLVGVGVLDMLRFHLFTVGWAWVNEYGSPDDPEHFSFLHAYSPLHQVRPGTVFPPTLVYTGDHDDRVFPAHSYKFTAALQHAQAGDAPVLLRLDRDSGHGAGRSTEKQIQEAADLLAFAWEHVGDHEAADEAPTNGE